MEVKFDYSSFEQAAWGLGAAADQVPYIFSRALNDAAFATRRDLIQTTWPSSVEIHNPSFLGAALLINKADKYNLTVEINDRLRRASLALHAYGGTKQPRKHALAIPPTGKFPRGPRGIARAQRPANIVLGAIPAKTKPGKFRALRIIESKGMFLGVGGRLELQYSFKRSARQPADVPFEEDFRRDMIAHFEEKLPGAVRAAMKTRR